MFATGAPAIAAANMFVWVMRYAVWYPPQLWP